MAIDWKGAKADYATAGAPLKDIAERHGCSISALRKKAKKEGWQRGVRPIKRRGAASAKEAGQEDVMDGHKHLWVGVKKRFISGLGRRDAKKSLEELKVAKVAGDVLTMMIKGERLAWGIDRDREERGEVVDPAEVAREMEEATLSSGADEALD